jgi:hypothetical protein
LGKFGGYLPFLMKNTKKINAIASMPATIIQNYHARASAENIGKKNAWIVLRLYFC